MTQHIKKHHRNRNIVWKLVFLSLTILCGIILLAGCATKPTKVSTVEEFIEAVENNEDIILKKDLDFSNVKWVPKTFSKSLDGNGHTIKNISVVAYSGGSMGIFSSAGGDSWIGEKIIDINFENINIEYYGTVSEWQGVGGLFGSVQNQIHIENVSISGTITAPNAMYVGGLVGNGVKSCTIENATINMTICGMDGVGGAVGGVQSSSTTFSNVTNLGTITSLYSAAGGIAGVCFRPSSFINCKNSGNITSVLTAGGIIGTGYVSDMSNCTNEGTITSTMLVDKEGKSGGIGGEVSVSNTITECSNKGKIVSKSDKIGGLFGELRGEGKITDCKNTAEVVGGVRVGGIIGQSSEKLQIINCKNEGVVTGDRFISGIVGMGLGNIFISNCSNHAQITGNNCAGGIVGGVEEEFGGTICFNHNYGKIVSTEYAAGIIGFTYNTNIKDVDTNKNSGEIQGSRTSDIFNS